MKKETLTILLPTFNRLKFLPRALKYIQEQSFTDWKCLVVNDGGESVATCVESMNDSRFEFFDRPHLGKAAALNFGLSKADGEYIAYMDDDDEIFPDHLESLYRAAVQYGAGFVYSDTYETRVDESSGEVFEERVENEKDVTVEMLAGMNYINHKQILHKKSLAEKIGGYDEQLPVLIDYDFIKRLASVEPPFHVRKITGRHFIYYNKDRISTITGLWERDPAACGKALIRIFEKAPADLSAFFQRGWQSSIIQQAQREEIARYQSMANQYHELTSGSFYKLLVVYGKCFPRGSRRRKMIAKPVRLLWTSAAMVPKTIRSIRENGLRFTLKKISSFFRAERGHGWMLDQQKYALVGTPEPIPSEAALPGKITVVVPVYNGLDRLKRLMPSLLANTPKSVSILMIDDCSSDEEIAPFLRAQAERDPRIKLLNNPENIGFVKTVNRAFEFCKDQDYVILLNTDTEVPPQWAERLLAPFELSSDIASVTPFSNGATIFSLPLTDDRNNRDFIRVFPLEEIDREIRKYSLPPEMRTAPCGVGFCMAMKNELIRQFGGFDEESFGKGFGEEVDWCRRVAGKGFKNVIAPNLFVSHFHGGSFASAERAALLEEHEKMLKKKHPDYHTALATHDLETAPVWDIVRCAATLGLLLKPEHDPVLILDHDWGGGANLYREKMIRELLADGKSVLLAQPEIGCIRLTAYYRDLSYSYHIRDFEVLRLLCFSGIRRIVLNELISWQYVYGKRVFSIALYRRLVEDILALKNHYGARLEYRFHDFFLICPHLNLVGMDRKYCDPGAAAAPCAGCITVRRHYEKTERYVGTITGELWRDAMRPLIANLDEIRFFSQNSIDVFRQVYAIEERQIKLAPHKPVIEFKPMRFRGGPVRIGCVGAIGEVKGAGFIVELANYLKTHAPDARIVVIGIIDAKNLPDNIVVHGEYGLSELPGLLERYGINIGFISSIWPETFSYVAQELMMLDLPLVCFDIGAPRDRIGKWDKGRIIPEITPESAWAAISELHRTCYQGGQHA